MGYVKLNTTNKLVTHQFIIQLLRFKQKCFIILIIFSAILTISSCKSTKHVPQGKYLLRNNKVIVTEKRTVSTSDVEPYIYQRPNRTMVLGLRFYLGLYNLAGADTSKWVNRTLRNWGEAPVIYDSLMAQSSIENINRYMRTRGYYHSSVTDSVVYKKKKANIYYVVKPNAPYRVKGISYDIADTTVRNIVLADTLSSMLRSGRRLATSTLDDERDRITSLMRDNGYYAFSKAFINYEADTLVNSNRVDLKVNIVNVPIIDSIGNNTEGHKKYRIKDVFIYADFDPTQLYSDSTYLDRFDTVYTQGFHLLHSRGLSLRAGVIPRASLIYPGMMFNEADVNQTYTNFSNLRTYKAVTIQFDESNELDDDGNGLINCIIQLNPIEGQSLKADVEVSVSSSDLIGFSPGLHYGHRNLFKGAEHFTLDFRGVFQYSWPGSSKYQNSFEYNIASSITLPQFLAPIRIAYFKKQIPNTKFAASYTYQRRPYYTRSVGAGSFGYLWNNSSRLSFAFNPIDFNMVQMLSVDKSFLDSIRNPYLQETYKDHFVLGMTASMVFTNQLQSQGIDMLIRRYRRLGTYYFRVNMDIGGNVLSLFNGLMKYNETDRYHMILNTRYSQYARIDFNFTYNKPVQTRSNLVYRVVFGIGKAYGNSNSLPFEKQFYAGGANSLRGWPIRGVGPGSAKPDTAFIIPHQLGDMRFEANLEYRFPLFWRFEGAAFVDAGNVWSISPKEDRAGAKFTSRFYKEIAANTGLGLRLNLGYFVIRLDAGFRLHDPARDSGEKFIAPNKWLKGGNSAVNIGVNYPF